MVVLLYNMGSLDIVCHVVYATVRFRQRCGLQALLTSIAVFAMAVDVVCFAKFFNKRLTGFRFGLEACPCSLTMPVT